MLKVKLYGLEEDMAPDRKCTSRLVIVALSAQPPGVNKLQQMCGRFNAGDNTFDAYGMFDPQSQMLEAGNLVRRRLTKPTENGCYKYGQSPGVGITMFH
jgi:hypothetical protein